MGGKLRISGLQNVDNVDNILKANYLMNKEKLNELALVWEGDVSDTRRAMEVLSSLQPHTNLTKLVIHSYAGLNFPHWFGDSSFSKMVSIYLSGNEYCLFLPPLGQLPSLQELVIESFHGVEEIGPEFYTGNSACSMTPFQCSKILKCSEMKSWKAWSLVGRDGKEDGCFPRLKNLHIDGCPNLAGSLPNCDTIESLKILESCKFMESLPLNNFPKLKKLNMQGCGILKELIVDSPDVIETLNIEECNKLGFPRSHHIQASFQFQPVRPCAALKGLSYRWILSYYCYRRVF